MVSYNNQSGEGDNGGDRDGKGNSYSPFMSLKKPLFQRHRTCPLQGVDNELISYKNPELLRKYLSERGRITPSRLTSIEPRRQARLAQQLKIARLLALVPYVSNN